MKKRKEKFMKSHKIEIRVRWGDVDNAGIIYHPNVFHYFEIGIEEFFRAIGLAYPEAVRYGIAMPRVEVKANFLAPLKFDDLLELETRVEEIKEKSIKFGFEVKREKSTVITGHIIVVTVDPKKWKAIPVPRELTDRLR